MSTLGRDCASARTFCPPATPPTNWAKTRRRWVGKNVFARCEAINGGAKRRTKQAKIRMGLSFDLLLICIMQENLVRPHPLTTSRKLFHPRRAANMQMEPWLQWKWHVLVSTLVYSMPGDTNEGPLARTCSTTQSLEPECNGPHHHAATTNRRLATKHWRIAASSKVVFCGEANQVVWQTVDLTRFFYLGCRGIVLTSKHVLNHFISQEAWIRAPTGTYKGCLYDG